MTDHDDETEPEDLQTQDGVAGEEAADELTTSPEDKRNFTETHPDEARRERERVGDDQASGT